MATFFPTPLPPTRLPTPFGEFQLYLFIETKTAKEHIALVMGDIHGQAELPVRIHSECYTGDVLGSTRCDCGSQLKRAMQYISQTGLGIIIYLRQEGRGIGLADKLRAYNLQDTGYDTVEANLMLGHQADDRDYSIAGEILNYFKIQSVQLLTNNPQKIASLKEMGLTVTQRIPLPGQVTPENMSYLQTKISRMAHYPSATADQDHALATLLAPIENRLANATSFVSRTHRAYVTLSYAQSLDGCLTIEANQPTSLSNPQAYLFTHHLRAKHEGLLVGINTILVDDPHLTVRLTEGPSPRPIVLDTKLRFPLDTNLLKTEPMPWIITGAHVDPTRQRQLEDRGASIFHLPINAAGQINLPDLLHWLADQNIPRLMVEGGSRVITSFLKEGLANQLVLTLAPKMFGGLRAVQDLDFTTMTPPEHIPTLKDMQHQTLGDNLILHGHF